MNMLLYRIRIGLAAVPALVSIAGVEAGAYGPYVAYALLALLLAKAATFMPKYASLLLFVELIGFAWFAYAYGGILYLLLFSTLVAIFRTGPDKLPAVGWTALGLVLLAACLYGSADNGTMLAVAVLWIATAAILHAANDFEDKRHRFEDLYEALAASHEELDAARRRMLDYASQIERYAQSEERSRIAKDIHDDLGHRLIRVKMMSEAALHLFDADTARAKGMVEQMRDQLQDSMERMRRTVRRLAAVDERDARRYALDRLVQESADALGIEIRFEVSGSPHPLYPSLELILFNNAREAITNAVRHGQATEVAIELRFREDSVSLTVANNGALPDEPIEPGLGMRGMKERIALIGGRLEWHRGERFSVTTVLPLLGGRTPP
ncbi:sensor histidine kinase [Paenibacillus arenilitoris]|uniref:histidine kinase n=1 Tax=Paenibacillus arenilitoris TaxID=2772299 RepID=A0A927CR20_9BACL|nr:sensor histidine kinase [Paenibacillus arenilitoris]MBD2870070.1 sensor histidine kinase [Paenibacillus arenilitoris]